MFASLPMYARAELDTAHENFWNLICQAAKARGIALPQTLDQSREGVDHWLSSDMAFSQACGFPYVTKLRGKVQLLGTPDYGLDDCPKGFYRSALIVAKDSPIKTVEQLSGSTIGVNSTLSQSGFRAALELFSVAQIQWGDMVLTEGHLNSIKAVANGRATCATIDAVTWRLADTYGDAGEVRVLSWSSPKPGLPYITNLRLDAKLFAVAIDDAIAGLSPADQTALGIQSLVRLDDQDYAPLMPK